MAFNSYQEGLNLAQDLGRKAIQIEASLATLSPVASPIPVLQKAFPTYIAAAEAYGHLLSSKLVPASEISAVKKKWRLVLERAEKVKVRVETLGGHVGKALVGDEGEEKAAIRRGSTTNGVAIPLWTQPTSKLGTGDPYREATQPELADAQQDLEPEWRELPENSWVLPVNGGDSIMKQGLVADCSVVAAMGVMVEHGKRLESRFGWSNLYPQNQEGYPIQSNNGQHVLKLLLNGAWRSVVFDALLPHSRKDGSPLYTTCHSTPPTSSTEVGIPWVPLALKGYFKVHGGYSLKGSDPSSDLREFTGWVPERVSLKGGFQREKAWTRVKTAWERGDVLVGLGTGDEVRPGLVKRHAFGVTSLREDGDDRMLDITDPGASAFSMSWDEVCANFETLYLNWKPELKPVVATRDWSWVRPPDTNGEGTQIMASPQYRLRVECASSSGPPEIWILLSQHISSRDRPLDDIALHIFEKFETASKMTTVINPERLETNPYANITHVLVRYQARRSLTNLIIIPARDRGIYQTGFTLNVYGPSGSTINLERVSSTMPFTESVAGTVSSRNAGGHPGCPSYIINPQYKVVVESGHGKVVGRLVLQGDRTVPWNVKLLGGKGELVSELSQSMVLADSGPYSYGMAYCDVTGLSAGTYTLVVSTFQPDQIGQYSLTFEATAPVHITSIAQEGADMYRRVLHESWTDETAGGRPSSGTYDRNPKVEVILPKPGTVLSRLYLPSPSPVPINLTIFERAEGGALGTQVATTGPYSDLTSGVATGRLRLNAGIYVLVPSTYEGCKKEWVLKVWSDVALSVEAIKRR